MSGQFYIKTFGCQMNVSDSERMAALFAEQGMTLAESPSSADVIIINGCTIREKAVHKAVSALGELQLLKIDENGQAIQRKISTSGAGDNATPVSARSPIIGIGGCIGQLDQGALFKRAPYLDFVFGTDTIDQLPELIYRVRNGERHIVHAEFDPSMSYSTETKVFGQKAQAFVNIMKGCDKYCTYCIVPYTRGKEKSRTIDEVLDDIARLVATGVREVTLLGQNVNSFGKGNANLKKREPAELSNIIGKVGPRAGEENFPQLLRAIDQDPRCKELRRIRFTSSHPLDFSDQLIECYAPPEKGGVQRLAAHLHLPVQSGSNRVLQKMGRHHQIESYIAQMDRLRELLPNVGLSTDLIVGFPTETEAEFEQTIQLLDRLQYDMLYAFAYSRRPGTRAAKLPDDVPEKEKNQRLNRLLQHQLTISEKRYRQHIGKVMEILVEGEAKNQNIKSAKSGDAESSRDHLPKAPGRVWTGRTSCNRVTNFFTDSPRNLTGQFVNVKIIDSARLSLQGEWLNRERLQ